VLAVVCLGVLGCTARRPPPATAPESPPAALPVDASARPPHPDALPLALSDKVVHDVMVANYRRIVPCLMEARRNQPDLSDVDMELLIAPSGELRDLRVNGQKGGLFPACLRDRLQLVRFPPFRGSETRARWSIALQ